MFVRVAGVAGWLFDEIWFSVDGESTLPHAVTSS
jgi:hypothetical protein